MTDTERRPGVGLPAAAVLAAIAQDPGSAFPTALLVLVEKRLGNRVFAGSLSDTLGRLEDAGLIRRRPQTEAVEKRPKGRPRVYYDITEAGAAELDRARRATT